MADLYILDADVLIAVSDPANTLHADATRTLATVPADQRRIHPVNLAEVLVGPARAGLAEAAAADWAHLGVVALPGDCVTPAQVATVRAQCAVRLPDAYALASAIHAGVCLVTFDERLRGAAQRAGVTVLPV
jgi:predicted nucleic acid-binding protein